MVEENSRCATAAPVQFHMRISTGQPIWKPTTREQNGQPKDKCIGIPLLTRKTDSLMIANAAGPLQIRSESKSKKEATRMKTYLFALLALLTAAASAQASLVLTEDFSYA